MTGYSELYCQTDTARNILAHATAQFPSFGEKNFGSFCLCVFMLFSALALLIKHEYMKFTQFLNKYANGKYANK